MTASPPASSTPCTSGTAKVTATSRMKPNTTDATTAMTMPRAAVRDADRVSSLMCADASNPVIVYCDISRPMPNTNQKAESENPELLMVSPNTKAADWWLSGTKASTATTTATPTMCHHAEMVFSSARMLMPSRFSPSCSAAITVKTMKIVPVSLPMPGNHRLSSAVVKIADPYWMAAVTAISPTRLNHPVNQPHAGPPSLDAQKYSAPAVGMAEAISPIAMATSTQKKPTRSQPHVMATGPPLLNAM